MQKISKKLIIIAIIMVSALLFKFGFSVSAQSSDGIAMRIAPNPNHYSALRWYQENIDENKQGSPAQLLVDGYTAVRDGRTVYVNAANVSGVGAAVPPDLYTNIYILSYTQNAANNTTDIFGQMLNNWTFNINLVESASQAGQCMNIKDNQPDAAGKLCYTDFDCGVNSGLFCSSEKAGLTRDVRRLADLADINSTLESYYTGNLSYPALSAGTYVQAMSLSVWPSWRETLGQALSKTLPIDPLNKFYGCAAPYDAITCWNDQDKSFKFGNNSALPQGHVYQYKVVNGGKNYNLCAVMETADKYDLIKNNSCREGTPIEPPEDTSKPFVWADSSVLLQKDTALNLTITAQAIGGKTIDKWEVSGDGFSLQGSSIGSRTLHHDGFSSAGVYTATVSVKDNKEYTRIKTITVTVPDSNGGGGPKPVSYECKQTQEKYNGDMRADKDDTSGNAGLTGATTQCATDFGSGWRFATRAHVEADEANLTGSGFAWVSTGSNYDECSGCTSCNDFSSINYEGDLVDEQKNRSQSTSCAEEYPLWCCQVSN